MNMKTFKGLFHHSPLLIISICNIYILNRKINIDVCTIWILQKSYDMIWNVRKVRFKHMSYAIWGMFLYISHDVSSEQVKMAVFSISIFWVTTSRQNWQIIHLHLPDRFIKASETACQTIGTHQRLSVPTQ